MALSMIDLLKEVVERKASDLHLAPGSPPRLRIDGKLVPLEEYGVLSPSDTKQLVYSVLTDLQKKKLEEELELDFSFGIKGVARFRGNAYFQRTTLAAAFRIIPYVIPKFSDLGLPPIVENFAHQDKGLILVTGPTGSGKSTTLASLIDIINRTYSYHILTIEDPIEFVYEHKKSLVTQRELGTDTKSFANALKAALREDPDVILVGEMRDPETIEAALTAAETGHLVFSTLHTNSTIETINRIIDVFPANKQAQVRTQLSFVLVGIVAQKLIKRKNGKGRVVAAEVFIPTPAIRNLIRENKLHQIYSMMQTSQASTGMITMNQSLAKLYLEGEIELEDALRVSPDPRELESLIKAYSREFRR
ncbi:type IV pilus twitching motility protein PilT [Phorcysia thermohydrogeniphila]|uniref:Twitching motility protein PilT n=1 Tax=Phorcysia thermohydrogeniphila TaxID=936138 RepID=A0A4R1GDT7_9BACT|nr:type IV pilus twitching motility protein PilT [Phorcysia thermohydrogeniphila]TCK06274.1 twitching motility protein PilT [Phorcysia thermohydrogeniphila]